MSTYTVIWRCNETDEHTDFLVSGWGTEDALARTEHQAERLFRERFEYVLKRSDQPTVTWVAVIQGSVFIAALRGDA